METRSSDDKGSSVTAEQLRKTVSRKLPPGRPPWLTPFWLLLIRAGISVLILVSLFVVGGRVGFIIGLALFVVGILISVRIRRY